MWHEKLKFGFVFMIEFVFVFNNPNKKFAVVRANLRYSVALSYKASVNCLLLPLYSGRQSLQHLRSVGREKSCATSLINPS